MVIRIKGVNDIKTVVTTLMVYKKVRRKKREGNLASETK